MKLVPLGKNLEELKALALTATIVIDRATTHTANQLAVRSDLDAGDRLAAFDAFTNALLNEAQKAPLDGFLEADEAGGKEVLCSFIRASATQARLRLMV